MTLKTWTDAQDATLDQLQAQKDAAVSAANADIDALVQNTPATSLDASFAPIVAAFLKTNAQAVFDTLNVHYSATPPAPTMGDAS